MNIGHVAGGTNAGWRKVRQQHEPWACPECRIGDYAVFNARYLNQCKSCGNPRSN